MVILYAMARLRHCVILVQQLKNATAVMNSGIYKLLSSVIAGASCLF